MKTTFFICCFMIISGAKVAQGAVPSQNKMADSFATTQIIHEKTSPGLFDDFQSDVNELKDIVLSNLDRREKVVSGFQLFIYIRYSLNVLKKPLYA